MRHYTTIGLALFALASCGGGGGGSGGVVLPPLSTESIASEWSGYWASISGAAGGSLTFTMEQDPTGDVWSDDVRLIGAQCRPSNHALGTYDGLTLWMEIDILQGGGQSVLGIMTSFAEIDTTGRTLAGSYSIIGSTCTRDSGDFMVTR